jgi:dGTPase
VSTPPGYRAADAERWVAEPPKTSGRGVFERDRARVLHSSALRRLAAKTQVVAVGAGDFPRTRLTHSLECAQIGRELGRTLGCDPDLVDAACLAHDLGHPPFGHNGESALAVLAAGCGGFEGNAQSLRLLTRLETKVPGAGLNLTRATLDATLKYPWLAGKGPAVGHLSGQASTVGHLSGQASTVGHLSGQASTVGHLSGQASTGTPKFGAYEQDADVFDWIRLGAPPGRACLEAQAMDWADDVAYSVHDLEDGLHAGLITLAALRDPAEQQAIAELTATAYLEPGTVSTAELSEVFQALLGLGCWPGDFDGGPHSLAALKNLTSDLIGRFCRAAQDASLQQSGRAPGLTRYRADLVVPRTQRLECALLKGVTARYVMNRAGVREAQAAERDLVAELAAAIEAGAPQTLDPVLRPSWDAAGSAPEQRRIVIDQVASLTDTSAIAWHERLCRRGRVTRA